MVNNVATSELNSLVTPIRQRLWGHCPHNYKKIYLQRCGSTISVSWFKKNMMTEGDNPPVGILLCTQKDHALVEYALAGMDNQLFVSKYQLELPKKEEMQRFLEEKMREIGE